MTPVRTRIYLPFHVNSRKDKDCVSNFCPLNPIVMDIGIRLHHAVKTTIYSHIKLVKLSLYVKTDAFVQKMSVKC